MNTDSILDKLKAAKEELARKYGVSSLALFGSYSRNEQTENSDIDIMVDVERPIGIRYIDLAEELQMLFNGSKVQVVSKEAIKPKYFERLKKDLLYA